ncbi:MAG: hypothetical protein R3E84_19130 [Pseudomonadales bacterium]
MLGGCEQPTTTIIEPSTDTAVAATPAGVPPAGIEVRVQLDALPADLPDTARLFVFTRKPGTRMPLGVEQYAVYGVPGTVTFPAPADSPVEVVARLSPTGAVEKQPGDYEAVATAVAAHPPVAVLLRPVRDDATRASSGDHGSMTAQAGLPSAGVRVVVDYAGTTAFAPDTTVFVAAKRRGEAMPLVARKLRFADLPANLALTDADALLPGRSLAGVAALDITGLVSTSGSVSRQSGDWTGIVSAASDGVYVLHIDRQVP